MPAHERDIEQDSGMWPDGERPSGWPGTDPAKNVRDLYDEIENSKRARKAGR